MTLNLRKYAQLYILLAVLVVVASFGLSLVNIDMPTGLSTILPPMVAAQMLGAKHGEATGAPLAKGEAWRLAVPMTVCAVVVQIVLGVVWGGVMMASGVDLMATFGTVGLPGLAIVFGLMILIIYLVNRAFLGLGVRNGMRAAQRKAAK
ncbi:ABZJ_00895 family protein [Shimia abyssi]|uniref:Uncharacterized protein n=1 Tax=Shimia abyssi TaxID=1662395 RepID=A0A2P8F821_9RHOB|nr:ABZJ_00895 family protein [Shimia abyssi]PSL17859.1 hypothetical protein CLV88_11471 [Shimia abyssi]